MESSGPPREGRPTRPPVRVGFPGALLRRWSPSDAAALHAAISASHPHLRPWMPWAAAPPVRMAAAEFIDGAVEQWNAGEEFVYGLFDHAETAVLGSIGLHRRLGPEALVIGYWAHVDHTGKSLISTGSAALTQLAFDLPGIERVEIHCDEANTASAAVPRRLGYHLDRVEDSERKAPAEVGRQLIWVMSRGRYPGSEAERRAQAVMACNRPA